MKNLSSFVPVFHPGYLLASFICLHFLNKASMFRGAEHGLLGFIPSTYRLFNLILDFMFNKIDSFV